MNCVIIEDEYAGQELIKFKLSNFFPEINILKIIDNKIEAIEFLSSKHNKIDFIFLDIEIKGGNGIQILEGIKNRKFEVIFITAYENYALQAFQLDAKHYLLKPFKDEQFIEAVQRVQSNYKERKNAITINNKNEIVQLLLNDILYFKSDGTYTEIITNDTKYLSTKSLGDYSKSLNPRLFFRIHHSYIVNTNFIDRIEKNRTGNIYLKNGEILPVSQRKLKDFLEHFEK